MIEPKSGAQSMGFSPADVAARRWRLIEGNELVARAAGIVRDDHVFAIESHS